MRTTTVLSTTAGMHITWPRPTAANGSDVASPVALTISPAGGTAGRGRLTPAGVQAMTAAVAAHIGALSAEQAARIDTQHRDGGLTLTVSPELVTVPCLHEQVPSLAAALAAVLAVGANVQVA